MNWIQISRTAQLNAILIPILISFVSRGTVGFSPSVLQISRFNRGQVQRLFPLRTLPYTTGGQNRSVRLQIASFIADLLALTSFLFWIKSWDKSDLGISAAVPKNLIKGYSCRQAVSNQQKNLSDLQIFLYGFRAQWSSLSPSSMLQTSAP
jgi:hypothetical protein